METLRQVLARRMRALMDADPNLDTQMKVHKATGVAQATVGRVLSQTQSATVDMVERLASAFKVPPTMLLLEPNQIDLLRLWAKLDATQQNAILGYMDVVATSKSAPNNERQQLHIDSARTIPPQLQAASKRDASRRPGTDILQAAHGKKTKSESPGRSKRRKA